MPANKIKTKKIYLIDLLMKFDELSEEWVNRVNHMIYTHSSSCVQLNNGLYIYK